MAILNIDEIGRSFAEQIVDRGQRYERTGQVFRVEVLPDESYVAKVRGSESQPYKVRLQFAPNTLMPIVTTCSCPYEFQCKHGAALAFALLRREAPLAEPSVLAPPEPPAPSLPGDVTEWLHILAGSEADPDYLVPDSKFKLGFFLDLESTNSGPQVCIRVFNRPILKTGELGKEAPYNVSGLNVYQFQKHINAYERELLLDLVRNGSPDYHERGRVRLEGRHGARLVDLFVESRHCRWGSADGPRLFSDADREGTLNWEVDRMGYQTPNLRVFPPGVVLPLNPRRYVDVESGAVGRVSFGESGHHLAALLSGPPIPPEYAETVRARLADIGIPDTSLPMPPIPVERIAVAPTIRLDIQIEMCETHAYSGFSPTIPIPFARIQFEYAGNRLRATDKTELRKVVGGRVQIVQRDKKAEAEAITLLRTLGWKPADYLYPAIAPRGRGTDLCFGGDYLQSFEHLPAFEQFLESELPALRERGWIVELTGATTVATADKIDWQVGLHEATDSDWFEFKLGIVVGGKQLDLRSILPKLLAAPGRSRDTPAWHRPEPPPSTICIELDGVLVVIPRARVMALIQPLIELFGDPFTWPKELSLPKSRLPDAIAIEHALGDDGAVWFASDALADLHSRLMNFAGLKPASEPKGFTGELRDYQRHGPAWLQFLREFGFGGILADDMGLGKTVQVLAYIQGEKRAGRLDRPCLVVAPTSTLPNWEREVARFTPKLRVIKLHGAARKAEYKALDKADVALTNYAILTRDRAELVKAKFHLVVLDEAQNVKNAATASAKVARELDARQRLALSGTPVENHLGELWSLFHFLMPGFLGTAQAFRKEFRAPIEQHGDADAAERLEGRIRPFMLRRTKLQVATELPPISEIVETVELGGPQRDLYESVRVAMDQRVRQLLAGQGLDRSRVQILDALLKLRQVCCDPRLVKLESARAVTDSAKLERLREMLGVLLEEGRKVLLFSQFTSMLDLIEPMLREMNIGWVRISGDTVDRDTPVQRFQNGAVPVFLISLKAGGTGLNLVAADTVIHYDPWWNPAVERQATDRAHRIGQDKPVMAYKLVAAGTVEEKILELQRRKGALADRILAGAEAASTALRQEDLSWLFERD